MAERPPLGNGTTGKAIALQQFQGTGLDHQRLRMQRRMIRFIDNTDLQSGPA
jgi:hypothetical protein